MSVEVFAIDERIVEQVFHVLRECCDNRLTAELSLGTPLRSLQMDSLKMVQIVYELEVALDIELEEHRLFQLESVGDLAVLAADAAQSAA
ncbi:MAG: phosphopantetheine-binding protein [Pseudohongiellaceae bacterium]